MRTRGPLRRRRVPAALAAVLTGGLLTSLLFGTAAAEAPSPRTVRTATIHFAPEEGKVGRNRAKMVELASKAAENGAKIIVLPEMATSGYSFFSRDAISRVAERVPGRTTDALGAVARRHRAYIVFGMPVSEPRTRLYHNSAVMLGPDGAVRGTYRKRNHLIESAYNASNFGRVPLFETEYGRVGLLICSDMFYSQFPRAAAVQGADILIAPANVGIDTDFMRVRTFENDVSMIVSNRWGKGTAGSKPSAFTQNTFTIPSAFPYDFDAGTRSAIVTAEGKVLADVSGRADRIGYGDLPVRTTRAFPVVRKPALYSLMGQDTLEPLTRKRFQQPPAGVFTAAAVDPGAGERATVDRGAGATSWRAALAAAKRAEDRAASAGKKLRLIVFPADSFPAPDAEGPAKLKEFAKRFRTDLLIHFPASAAGAPRSTLIASTGRTYAYTRTHRGRGEPIPDQRLSNDYLVIDRDYARLALLQDIDMMVPETAHVLARMGVDVVAMNADRKRGVRGAGKYDGRGAAEHDVRSAMWRSRTGDYLHVVTADRSAPEGIYLGGYRAKPPFTEAEGVVMRDIDTGDVRDKPSSRFFDPTPLLEPCEHAKNNC